MLPPGLTADLASSSSRAALQTLHPRAKTVAQLLVGACSCDLVRTRLDNPIEDERELRSRYQREKLSRVDIIRELERHRGGSLPRPKPPGGWAGALAGFVVEHARNAGPTLYLMDFGTERSHAPASMTAAPVACSVPEVRLQAGQWLSEGRPVVVG